MSTGSVSRSECWTVIVCNEALHCHTLLQRRKRKMGYASVPTVLHSAKYARVLLTVDCIAFTVMCV